MEVKLFLERYWFDSLSNCMYRLLLLLGLWFGISSSTIVLADDLNLSDQNDLVHSDEDTNGGPNKKKEPLDWKVAVGITLLGGGLLGYIGSWWWKRKKRRETYQNLTRSATTKFVQAEHLPRKDSHQLPRRARLHFTNENYIVPIELQEGRKFILGADPEIIVENGHFIDDPFLSNNHAEIICLNGIFYIQDTNSTNGTLVNGQDIRNSNIIELKQGTIINLGNTYIEFIY
jgi:hypothetical protein